MRTDLRATQQAEKAWAYEFEGSWALVGPFLSALDRSASAPRFHLSYLFETIQIWTFLVPS